MLIVPTKEIFTVIFRYSFLSVYLKKIYNKNAQTYRNVSERWYFYLATVTCEHRHRHRYIIEPTN